jgi:hypothetical protein
MTTSEAAQPRLGGARDRGRVLLPALRFVLSRLTYILVTLFVVTAALYGIVMLAPVEARAALYLPPRTPPYQSPEVAARVMPAGPPPPS